MKKYLIALTVILLPLYVGVYYNLSEFQLSFVLLGTVAAFFLANIDKLKYFKFHNLEIELKEAIHEAHVTTEALRSLIKLVLLRQYDDYISTGRFVEVVTDDSNTAIKELAIKLDLYDDRDIKEKRKKIHYLLIRDELSKLTRIPKTIIDSQYQDQVTNLENDLIKLHRDSISDYSKIPTPTKVKSIFENYNSFITSDLSSLNTYEDVYNNQSKLIEKI